MVRELQPSDPRLVGPYRLLGQLGRGGMGRVYLGLATGDRRVAVKVIRAELAADPQFRVRFRREVAAARTVSGPFMAPVVDADVDAEAPWLATAYVAGPSLAQAVRQHGPLPVDSVLALAAGLAESLSVSHAAGVVHRDLKPSNVLLAEDGPRVTDLGIGQAAQLGSPGFMSPEQAKGGDVGPPSDVFSLGAVLVFAAKGQGPFGSGSPDALIHRVLHSRPDLHRVPALLRPLVERCLAKDPTQRPAAADFVALPGVVTPVTGWLPDSVLRTFRPDPAPAAERTPAAPQPAPGPGLEDPEDPQEPRARRRFWRR